MRTVAFCALLLFILWPAGAPAAEEIDFFGRLSDQWSQWWEENSLDDVLGSIQAADTAERQTLWEDVEGLLSSPSVEEIASYLPDMEDVLNRLSAVPAAAPYADWLRQRLDYFEVADEVMRSLSSSEPLPAMPTPMVVPSPTPRPPSYRKTPVLGYPIPADRYRLAIRNENAWKKKVAAHSLPEGADTMIPALKQAFVEEGVPPEWVWLAEVESSLNPRARSPSGAVGLFQFMPGTARRFGLQTGFPDERMYPTKSARAAAQYLKVLHRQFGSWPLAIAAYNAGEGCVGRTLKKNGGGNFDEVADDLPLQTQMYVPKVMATVALREGVNPASLPPPRAAP